MLASYNTVFTYFLLTSSLSGVFFDPIHQKFGTFAIRCILGTMTTLGLVLFIFYQDNSNIIYGVWQLIGLPSSFYIVSNTKELCPIFPKVRNFQPKFQLHIRGKAHEFLILNFFKTEFFIRKIQPNFFNTKFLNTRIRMVNPKILTQNLFNTKFLKTQPNFF